MRRRSLLGLGLASAGLLALAGTGVAWWRHRPWLEARLTPSGQIVMVAVASAVLDAVLPENPTERGDIIARWLQRLEAAVAGMPAAVQAEFSSLMGVLSVAPGRRALTGMSSSWGTATVIEVQRALQTMRTSSLLVRRQAYSALRDLTYASYFADEATWPALGYPGPSSLP